MISKDRTRFIFHRRWAKVIREFSWKIRLEVIEAVFDYANTGKTPELSPVAQGLFAFIKYDLENDGIECPNSIEGK